MAERRVTATRRGGRQAPKAEKCPNCGACKECGAGGRPHVVPMPYPVYPSHPAYPRPVNPYRPHWISQPQVWGIGANQVSGGNYAQPWNNGGANSLH